MTATKNISNLPEKPKNAAAPVAVSNVVSAKPTTQPLVAKPAQALNPTANPVATPKTAASIAPAKKPEPQKAEAKKPAARSATAKAKKAAKPAARKPAAKIVAKPAPQASRPAAAASAARPQQAQVFSFAASNVPALKDYTERFSRGINETMTTGKDQVEALVTSTKIASDLGRDIHESLTKEMNALYADSLDYSKSLLSCRNVNDLMELQTRFATQGVARLFEQSSRLVDAWFKLATEATDPLNAQANQIASRFGKTLCG